jgi:hypothetical protein
MDYGPNNDGKVGQRKGNDPSGLFGGLGDLVQQNRWSFFAFLKICLLFQSAFWYYGLI